ncbi:DUF4296 domain-containing protein [Cellulophaga sp. F20128]|uniref:DUF4296 domain-containing protein n=1 Tax=Cellulophaga sp. F20128 TaxID=2926413 RepID=UPI001FF5DF1A|nr:DUF4296 domain-containing protein [Cellulophaga sp. F20128]MCK0158656.1 DUF4296 domain-containing protein [Cellulophaga sp. F20128]
MKKFSVIILLLAFVSCAEKLIEKPQNLIPKKKMINVLYDLAIITAAKNSNSAELIENNIETMPYIYAKYNIDSIQFAESDLYYAADPTNYEDLFIQVQTRLDKEKSVLTDARKVKNDSISKANDAKAKSKKVKDTLLRSGPK